MGDDVVKHLPTINIFEEHIPMIIRPLHIAHATDERMVEQGNHGCLSCRTNFFGPVRSFVFGIAMLICGLSRHYLNCDLYTSASNNMVGVFDRPVHQFLCSLPASLCPCCLDQ